MHYPVVTIIVLNLNGFADTERCLLSLRKVNYPNFRTIVIDNGSTENDAERIRQSFPEARLLTTGKNIGFAAANNVGLRLGLSEGTDYFFLLNNDTEMYPDSLTVLVEYAESNPAAGIVGPAIYDLADSSRLSATSGSIHLLTGISSTEEVTDLHQHAVQHPIEIQFVTGCAFLIKRSVVERIGLLDDSFFLYYEEADWCIRAKKSGFPAFYVPGATVLHKLSSFIKTGSSFQIYHLVRSKIIFFRKHSPSFAVSLLIHIMGQLRPMLAYLLTGRFEHANAVVSGTMAGLRQIKTSHM